MNAFQGIESGQGILKNDYVGRPVNQSNSSNAMLDAIRKKRKVAKDGMARDC